MAILRPGVRPHGVSHVLHLKLLIVNTLQWTVLLDNWEAVDNSPLHVLTSFLVARNATDTCVYVCHLEISWEMQIWPQNIFKTFRPRSGTKRKFSGENPPTALWVKVRLGRGAQLESGGGRVTNALQGSLVIWEPKHCSHRSTSFDESCIDNCSCMPCLSEPSDTHNLISRASQAYDTFLNQMFHPQGTLPIAWENLLTFSPFVWRMTVYQSLCNTRNVHQAKHGESVHRAKQLNTIYTQKSHHTADEIQVIWAQSSCEQNYNLSRSGDEKGYESRQGLSRLCKCFCCCLYARVVQRKGKTNRKAPNKLCFRLGCAFMLGHKTEGTLNVWPRSVMSTLPFFWNWHLGTFESTQPRKAQRQPWLHYGL